MYSITCFYYFFRKGASSLFLLEPNRRCIKMFTIWNFSLYSISQRKWLLTGAAKKLCASATLTYCTMFCFFFNSIIPMILFNYRTKITVDESIKKIRVQSLTGTGNCHTFCTLWNLNVRVDFLEHSDRWTLSTSTDYWNNKWWIFPDNTLQFKQFKRYVGDSHPYVSIHCCFLVIKVEVYYGKFSGLFPC
jgi:hypothetical protein